MELLTDVISLYLGLVWGNIACYRKYQCKEKYISYFWYQNLGAHYGILAWKVHWIIHCLNNNRPTVWETIVLFFSKNLMGLKENSCCSTASLGDPGNYVNQSWCYKIFVIHHDLIFLGQISKFTLIGIDNWCKLFDVADVSFISKWWFFYYRNGLWNLLNRSIFDIVVLGLPVQFNWISKKFKREIRVSCKCFCGEWSAFGKE